MRKNKKNITLYSGTFDEIFYLVIFMGRWEMVLLILTLLLSKSNLILSKASLIKAVHNKIYGLSQQGYCTQFHQAKICATIFQKLILNVVFLAVIFAWRIRNSPSSTVEMGIYI